MIEDKVAKIWSMCRESPISEWSPIWVVDEFNLWNHKECYNPFRIMLFTCDLTKIWASSIYIASPCSSHCQCVIPFYIRKSKETRKEIEENLAEAFLSDSAYIRQWAQLCS